MKMRRSTRTTSTSGMILISPRVEVVRRPPPLLPPPRLNAMRRGFADAAERATERELTEQDWTRKTDDFKEGVKAWAEKRLPDFKNR